MSEIYFRPRSGSEVMRAAPGTRVAMYSCICENARRHGAYDTIMQMAHKSLKWIILLQDPFNEKEGHWIALRIKPETKEIYFFSSYGGKPDFEKNIWIPKVLQRYSNQAENVFNDGMKYMFAREGWTVHYNDYPFQQIGDKSATCGIWAVAFLNMDMNPDQFVAYTFHNKVSVYDYYKAFFSRE